MMKPSISLLDFLFYLKFFAFKISSAMSAFVSPLSIGSLLPLSVVPLFIVALNHLMAPSLQKAFPSPSKHHHPLGLTG